MRALGSHPPSRSPGELRLGKLGYLDFKVGGRFLTHKSSASIICESAEMIFSPANTVSGVYADAVVLIGFVLAFDQVPVVSPTQFCSVKKYQRTSVRASSSLRNPHGEVKWTYFDAGSLL